jgi:type VI secretion system protein ImpF
MAQLTPKEKLQPSLLDRLTDNRPDIRTSTGGVRVLSMEELRAGTRRDLTALLNATGLGIVQDLADFPHVQRSTLNFGMPDMSGKTASGVDVKELERTLARTIQEFEPRLLPGTLNIKGLVTDQMHHNVLTITIEAELWSQPLPQKLLLRTELDLETGELNVEEAEA